jgi:hypothetical protein
MSTWQLAPCNQPGKKRAREPFDRASRSAADGLGRMARGVRQVLSEAVRTHYCVAVAEVARTS